MRNRTVTISPAGLQMVNVELMRAINEGCSETEAADRALNSVGLGVSKEDMPVETSFVVDTSLKGTVFPFLEEDTPSRVPRS